MYNNNSTDLKKRQVVYYNTEFGRWEYYGENPVIRAGEPQPGFTSPDYQKCITYKMAVEGKL